MPLFRRDPPAKPANPEPAPADPPASEPAPPEPVSEPPKPEDDTAQLIELDRQIAELNEKIDAALAAGENDVELNEEERGIIAAHRATKAAEAAAAAKRESGEQLVERIGRMTTAQITNLPAEERDRALSDLVAMLTNQA